jgi:hypothetical protein
MDSYPLLWWQTRFTELVPIGSTVNNGGLRRFTLARVMAKLASIAKTAIAITCLVINLERRL